MHRTTLLLVTTLAAVATTPAQVTVRSVPGAYPTIPAAIAASAPCDVVEIGAGIYPAFDCPIGVTLRAATPGTVTFNLAMGFVPSTGVSMFFTAPAGETIHVVGVTFQFPAANFTAAQSDPRLDVTGRVVLESCTLTSASGNNAKGSLRVNAGAQVHVQDVTSFGPTLWVLGKATATQCSWRGQNIQGFSSAAIVLQGSGSLQASACTVTGGSSTSQTAGAAIDAAAGTRAWFVDSTLTPGTSIVPVCSVTGAGAVELARCVVAACPLPQSPEGLGAERTGPIVTGSTFTIEYTTTAFYPVGVHVSFELGDLELPWLLAQPWGAALGTSVDVGVGLADALGQASFSWAIPANPIFVGLPLWLHGFSGIGLPLQVAAPVGGVIR